MKATILLADYAEVINNKLYIMGGGWSVVNQKTGPTAIALKLEVPWNETNRKHSLKLELLDSDFHSVTVQTPAGELPLVINGDFEVGRPAGLIQGVPLDLVAAFNIGSISLLPGKRYIWKLSIGGESSDQWQVTFSTRPT